MKYLKGVFVRLILVLLLFISIPLGICINIVLAIPLFILGIELTDEMAFKIMFWPCFLLEKVLKENIENYIWI